MSPRSLVTGGAGFIGSHVVDELISRGHEVVVLDDLSGGFQDNVNSSAWPIWGSITDADLVDRIFHNHQIDYVYHLAAYAAEGLSPFIRRFNYTNNLIGSVNLINAAVRHDVKCFVFTSSIAVYGSGQAPFTEDMVPCPEDPYGIAKYAVELDLLAAHRQFRLPYIIFRPHNVYGERQNIGDPYRNVIGIFMRQILRGEPCTIFGDGWQTRAFTHISDVAWAIADSVKQPRAYNLIFNIGSDCTCSVNGLQHLVQHFMGRNTGVVHLSERLEVRDAYSSHNRAAQLLNAPSVIPLEDGLATMAAWVKRVGVRESKPFDTIELDKNLPESWRNLCGRR